MCVLLFVEPDEAVIREIAQAFVADALKDKKGKVDTRATIANCLPIVKLAIDRLRAAGVSCVRVPYSCNVETADELRDAILGDSSRPADAVSDPDADFDVLTGNQYATGLVGAFERLRAILPPEYKGDLHAHTFTRGVRELAAQNPIQMRLYYETNRTIAKWLCARGVVPDLDLWFEVGKFKQEHEPIAQIITRFCFHGEYESAVGIDPRQIFEIGVRSPFRAHLRSWSRKQELVLADLFAYISGAATRNPDGIEGKLLRRFTKVP